MAASSTAPIDRPTSGHGGLIGNHAREVDVQPAPLTGFGPIRTVIFAAVAASLLFAPPRRVPPQPHSSSSTAADSLSGWASQFLGRWNCVGAFASGKPLAADVQFTAILGGRWLQYHHLDRAPGRYEASAILGPARFDSTVAATALYDNFGGRRLFQVATTAEHLVTLMRDMTEPAARPERFVFRPRSQAQFWFAWELQREGAWVLGDSLQCHRAQ